jgi:hypothetical protein
MRRAKTKIGLVVVIGILAALAATGPASGAPPAQPGSGAAVAGAGAPARPPAPAGRTAPSASKLGTASAQVGGVHTDQLDGVCNTGDLCFWYYSGFQGSSVDFYWGEDTLWDNVFLSPGAGQGAVVANNAESAWNYDSSWTAWTCTGTYQTGYCGYILPNSGGNFLPTYFNNVESTHWTL